VAYPSTFADIQNAVIAKARLDSTTDLQKVKDWINQAYAQVCTETQAIWTTLDVTLTAGTYSYTLDARIIRIIQIVIQLNGQTWYGPPLRLASLDEILWRRQSVGGEGVTNGTSTYYTLVGQNTIELWPTPGGADTMRIYYVQQPSALVNGTDVPAIDEPYATKLLAYGALVEASDYAKDFITNYMYRQVYDEWMQRFRQHLGRLRGQQTKDFRVPGPRYYAPHDPSVDIGV